VPWVRTLAYLFLGEGVQFNPQQRPVAEREQNRYNWGGKGRGRVTLEMGRVRALRDIGCMLYYLIGSLRVLWEDPNGYGWMTKYFSSKAGTPL
jgi:hypothetical protein